MLNCQSFTPQVQNSESLSDSEHFDEESRDYLPSKSCENLLEDDSESTAHGLIDLQIIKVTCQHHVSGYACLV